MECVELAESVRCETQEINTGTIIRKKRMPVITISGMSRYFVCFVREAGVVPAAAAPRYCGEVGGAGENWADCEFGAGAAKFWRLALRGGAAFADAEAAWACWG